jgi:hypothetical protein
MESPFENIELINSKKKHLISLSTDNQWNESQFVSAFYFHGIKVCFYSSEKEFSSKILGYLPEKWIISNSSKSNENLNIYLMNNWNKDWDYEVNPDCLIDRTEDYETAIQRDFLGIDYGDHAILSLTDLHADGIFNSLRWLLPRRMLIDDTFLLHSSCVVDNGKAYFFLGQSGAGKSTVASLSEDRIVLGDDMNVMRFDGNKAYAKSGGLGGLSFSNTDFENEFEVAGFFWLEQSNQSKRTVISPSNGATKLLASLANVFWESMSENKRQDLLELALGVSSKVNFYQLEFIKNKEFWKHVTKR